MLQKTCTRCTHYDDGRCKLYRFYPQSPISTASTCDQFTTVNNTKQSCVNCVHYRDKRCFLHEFDVTDPEYSATICAEFTPINTQKSEMNKFEKTLDSSEDLTTIHTSQKSCETCEHGKIDQLHFLTCAAGIQDTFNEEDQYIFDEGFANDCVQYEPETKQQDPVNPSHYTQGKIECIDAIESALTPEEFRGFLKGNVFKYIWRHENKNGLQDVKKGEWYYQRLLKVLEDKDEKD